MNRWFHSTTACIPRTNWLSGINTVFAVCFRQKVVLSPRTKILFTSAYTENAIIHQGGLDKGVALLQKPFPPSARARKVREVLDQRDESWPENSQ
jgi:hypothetical protein